MDDSGGDASEAGCRPRRRRGGAGTVVLMAMPVVLLVGSFALGCTQSRDEQTGSTAPPQTAPSPTGSASSSPGATTAAPVVPMEGYPSTSAQWEQYARDHHRDGPGITWADYEAAVTRTVDCVRQEGMGILRPTLAPSGRYLFYSYGGGPEVDAVVKSCRQRFEDGPTRTWTIATALTPDDRAALEARVAQCIAQGRSSSHPPGTGSDAPEYVCVMGGAQDALAGPSS